MKRGKLQLSIASEKGGSRFIPFLRKMISKAHTRIPHCPDGISILIANDATMAKLHRQFLKMDGPTDVLTFEIERMKNGQVIEGEIVVCLGEARRQAKLRRIPVSHELLLYVVHGLLHLSGYDDVTAGGFREIHAAEDRILTAIGIGPTFVRDARAD